MVISLNSQEQEAFNVIKGIYESYRNFAPKEIEAVQLPEYSVWDGTLPQLFMSREDVKLFHQVDQKNTKARGKFHYKIEPLKVDIINEIAIVLSTMYAEWEPPNPWSGKMRITDILMSKNNKWKMLHHHESVEPSGYTHISQL